ncbi:MAG: helix-turn-helix domain-containing protein [Oscillospiraceae bacterium]
MCHYTHFTPEEWELSRVLQAQGLSSRAIARMLNRSPSSVSREFKRSSYSNGTYPVHHADKLYQKRRKNCGRKTKLKSGAVSTHAPLLVIQLFCFRTFSIISIMHCRLKMESAQF